MSWYIEAIMKMVLEKKQFNESEIQGLRDKLLSLEKKFIRFQDFKFESPNENPGKLWVGIGLYLLDSFQKRWNVLHENEINILLIQKIFIISTITAVNVLSDLGFDWRNYSAAIIDLYKEQNTLDEKEIKEILTSPHKFLKALERKHLTILDYNLTIKNPGELLLKNVSTTELDNIFNELSQAMERFNWKPDDLDASKFTQSIEGLSLTQLDSYNQFVKKIIAKKDFEISSTIQEEEREQTAEAFKRSAAETSQFELVLMSSNSLRWKTRETRLVLYCHDDKSYKYYFNEKRFLISKNLLGKYSNVLEEMFKDKNALTGCNLVSYPLSTSIISYERTTNTHLVLYQYNATQFKYYIGNDEHDLKLEELRNDIHDGFKKIGTLPVLRYIDGLVYNGEQLIKVIESMFQDPAKFNKELDALSTVERVAKEFILRFVAGRGHIQLSIKSLKPSYAEEQIKVALFHIIATQLGFLIRFNVVNEFQRILNAEPDRLKQFAEAISYSDIKAIFFMRNDDLEKIVRSIHNSIECQIFLRPIPSTSSEYRETKKDRLYLYWDEKSNSLFYFTQRKVRVEIEKNELGENFDVLVQAFKDCDFPNYKLICKTPEQIHAKTMLFKVVSARGHIFPIVSSNNDKRKAFYDFVNYFIENHQLSFNPQQDIFRFFNFLEKLVKFLGTEAFITTEFATCISKTFHSLMVEHNKKTEFQELLKSNQMDHYFSVFTSQNDESNSMNFNFINPDSNSKENIWLKDKLDMAFNLIKKLNLNVQFAVNIKELTESLKCEHKNFIPLMKRIENMFENYVKESRPRRRYSIWSTPSAEIYASIDTSSSHSICILGLILQQACDDFGYQIENPELKKLINDISIQVGPAKYQYNDQFLYDKKQVAVVYH